MDQGTHSLIKRHNDYVRDQVVRDLDALETKLNVKRQVGEKAHTVIDKAKGTLGMNQDGHAQSVGGFLRSNIVPLLAVGAGGAILARNAREVTTHPDNYNSMAGSTYSSGGEVPYQGPSGDNGGSIFASAHDSLGNVTGVMGDRMGSAKSTVADTASTMTDKVAGGFGSARSTVTDASSTVALQATYAKDAVVDHIPSRAEAAQMAKQNAPVVGLAALAAGVLAGAFAPRTRFEETKLAPLQETVTETVKEKATDVLDETVDRAKGASEAGKDAVEEELSQSSSDTSSGSGFGDPLTTTPNRITGAPTGSLPGSSPYSAGTL